MVSPFPRLQTAVVIFVLILGNASPVHPFVITTTAIITAAAQAISIGATMVGTTLQGISAANYKVTCAIQMENWTRYPMYYPTPRLSGGALSTAPADILPSKREGFSTRKTTGSYYGVWGTVTWEVKGADRLFVLMWYIPYSYDRNSNWMGLGMTRKGVTEVPAGGKLFDQMYYGKNSSDLTFIRSEYYWITDPIIYRDEQFEIVGIMSNVYRGEVKVTFRTTEENWRDLSEPIRTLLQYPKNCTKCPCNSQ